MDMYCRIGHGSDSINGRASLSRIEDSKLARPARRQRNVTGLWREMRVEGVCRSPQKMSDHRVAHIFRVARAFAPKPQHIAMSLGGSTERQLSSMTLLMKSSLQTTIRLDVRTQANRNLQKVASSH